MLFYFVLIGFNMFYDYKKDRKKLANVIKSRMH